MEIVVEFYGIPRLRAGTPALSVGVGEQGITLRDLLIELGRRLPDWQTACLEQQELRPEYSANLEGQHFVTDQGQRLYGGQTLLIMSADAGG